MKQWVKMLVGIALLVLFDQMTKLWAIAALKGAGSIPLISGVLELLYIENRGAAFGILQNQRWFFLVITVVVLAALCWFMPRIPKERRFLGLHICAYGIGAGAVGNMIDRIFRGYVVDFIYVKLIDFPVFNVADIYVTCAAVGLIFLVLFYYKDEDFERIFPSAGK